jgi:hypothetical protein
MDTILNHLMAIAIAKDSHGLVVESVTVWMIL